MVKITLTKNARTIINRAGGFVVLVFIASLLVLTLTGNTLPLNQNYFKSVDTSFGAFENSSPRSRFALVYAIVENKTAVLSLPLAEFATPDLATTGKNYVSLFAPGTSLIAVPGYLAGKAFGMPVLGTFVLVALFAFINSILIKLIAEKLGADKTSGYIAAFTFIVATPALSYAGVLYQHHITVFLILSSIYALLKFRPFIALTIVWFMCALSISVDYPNLFLLAPIGIYAFGKMAFIQSAGEKKTLVIKPLYLVTFLSMVLPLVMFLTYNQEAFGNKFQLAGTLKRVTGIKNEVDLKKEAEELNKQKLSLKLTEQNEKAEMEKKKDAVGFFNTRDILNGLYIHLVSADRGTLRYAPILFLGLFALPFLYKKRGGMLALILSVILVNLILYSMWGDPWGGWSFGSRYMVPSFALLAVLLGVALTRFGKNTVFIIVFAATLAYSTHVNILGAVSTSNIPPKVEVLALESVTGRVERYTEKRGYDYLSRDVSRSFIFNQYLKGKIRAWDYYHMLMYTYMAFGGLMVASYYLFNKDSKDLGDE